MAGHQEKMWAVWVDSGDEWQMYGGQPYRDKRLAKRHARDLRVEGIYSRVRVARWNGPADHREF